MRRINVETWPRYKHFKLFSEWDYPHFNMSTNVDLTAFLPVVKQREISLTIGIVYVIARVANGITEFRYRIRSGEVVEHEVVHPATTIMTDNDLFSFCSINYYEDFREFSVRAAEQIATVKSQPVITNEPGRDDLFYTTAIPWVSFTSFMHPINLSPVDSIPRFAWGKIFKEGQSMKMPLSAQAHHAVLDGIHMGRFFEQVQDYFSNPDFVDSH